MRERERERKNYPCDIEQCVFFLTKISDTTKSKLYSIIFLHFFKKKHKYFRACGDDDNNTGGNNLVFLAGGGGWLVIIMLIPICGCGFWGQI